MNPNPNPTGLGARGQARAEQGGRRGQGRRGGRDARDVDRPDQHRPERVLHRRARLGAPQPGVRAAALRRQLRRRGGGVHELGARRQGRLLEPQRGLRRHGQLGKVGSGAWRAMAPASAARTICTFRVQSTVRGERSANGQRRAGHPVARSNARPKSVCVMCGETTINVASTLQ